jgi:hypothetical protein
VVTASTLRAVIGDVGRFPSPRQLVGYLGLHPRLSQSGAGPARHGRTSKEGPAAARHVLVEAAWSAARGAAPLRAFAVRVAARRRRNIATVAVARKLAVLAWHLLTRGEDYAFARPSIVARKRRRLELAAGAPRRKPGPNGNPVWADGGPAPRRAAGRGAGRGRLPAPDRRLAGERAERGAARDTGARVFEAVYAASSAADLKAPAVCAVARRSPAPTRTVAKAVAGGKSSLTFISRTRSDGIAGNLDRSEAL